MFKGKANYKRVAISIALTIFGTIALFLHLKYYRNIFFATAVSEKPWEWLICRLIWCCMWGWIGLTVKSWFMRGNAGKFPPLLKSYFVIYPLFIFLMCCLIFSISHIFTRTSNQIFYTLTLPICFIVGLYIPLFIQNLEKLIKKLDDIIEKFLSKAG